MWESIAVKGGVGVDRESNTIRGYVVAQAGRFKSKGRGQFDDSSLASIVDLGNRSKGGIKSRLAHPTLSADGIGKLIGHARNFHLSEARTPTGDMVKAVRADLHVSPTSFKTPSGDLGHYVMNLAEAHPESFSSSLVLQADKEQALDADGKPAKDEDGTPHPPLWRPTSIHASDVVDTGDAVDGFLSAGESTLSIDGLPDALSRHAAIILEENFGDMDREELKAKVLSYIDKYLDWKYGEDSDTNEVHIGSKGGYRTFAKVPKGTTAKEYRTSEILRRIKRCGIDNR